MRPRRFGCAVTLALASMPVGGVFAQPSRIERGLNEILTAALSVNITARVVDAGREQPVWNMHVSRVTVSGRSVTVRLDGSNIVVIAEFTPYWDANDQLVLVAKGQTWLSDKPRGEPSYRTTFNSLPVHLGESVLFLPLGTAEVSLDSARIGQPNIELEVNVERFQS